MTMPTILLPLDGTAHSAVATPVARALASIEHAALHVVYLDGLHLPSREQIESRGLPGESSHRSVLSQAAGNPAEAIVRLAAEQRSAYIVLDTHIGMAKPSGALGQVARDVLLGAPCPVVLVQPNHTEPWALHQILLPHDGTPATAAAVGPAADLAHQAEAELIVLHIAALATQERIKPGTLRAPRYLDQPQHEWSAWAREFLERMAALGRRPAAVKLLLSVGAGEPGAEIVRFAREHEADLIVLAWSGHWEPARAATLKAVLRDSGCPVLIVRSGPANLAVDSASEDVRQATGRS